jgi:mannose/fructose-specific phosphotransferase system component IIA
MTSAIDSDAIIDTFPVAGKDNDSQGFRDNFSATKLGLATAAEEIGRLQSRTLKAADLSSENGTAVVNDLLGSTISNGLYKQFNGVYSNAGTISSTQNINLDNGPIQKVTISGNSILNFINWPDSGQYSTIQLMIIGNQQGTWTVNFTSEDSGTIWKSTTFTIPLSVTTNNNFHLIEAFTYDKGTTVFINKLAEYSSD